MNDGKDVGMPAPKVGLREGKKVGAPIMVVGVKVGRKVGVLVVGFRLGKGVGLIEGANEGDTVGRNVGPVAPKYT